MALKGVVNANFCISARYDTDTQLLYVEVDDPMGYINAKMERNPEQKDNSVASRSSALYPQNEVEPIILKGILEKNGGDLYIQRSSRYVDGYTITFTMKMYQTGNESSAQSQSVPKIEEELPSVSARVQKLHD